jgi:spore germination protein GerM
MNRAALALILILGACARQSGPVEVPRDELPFDVTRSAHPTRSPDAGRAYAVYLVRDGRLTAVTRNPEASTSPAVAVLRSLFDGPTARERDRGIATRIPAGVRALTVTIDEGDADIDLSGEFQEPAPPERIALRVAQVVWTLTSLDAVRTVSFSIDGEPISVPTDSGDHVERRLIRQDYSGFAPRG